MEKRYRIKITCNTLARSLAEANTIAMLLADKIKYAAVPPMHIDSYEAFENQEAD